MSDSPAAATRIHPLKRKNPTYRSIIERWNHGRSSRGPASLKKSPAISAYPIAPAMMRNPTISKTTAVRIDVLRFRSALFLRGAYRLGAKRLVEPPLA
jgi:hypothetical protein